jgi:hypothetical protein
VGEGEGRQRGGARHRLPRTHLLPHPHQVRYRILQGIMSRDVFSLLFRFVAKNC